MDMRNCPRCGKLFARISANICPSCEKEEELIFEKVRNFVDENKNCTLAQVSVETGASGKKILRYVKEGRLEISTGMQLDVRCEMCGRPMGKGRYCDSCVIKINHSVKEIFSEKKPDAKMHTRSDKTKI